MHHPLGPFSPVIRPVRGSRSVVPSKRLTLSKFTNSDYLVDTGSDKGRDFPPLCEVELVQEMASTAESVLNEANVA